MDAEWRVELFGGLRARQGEQVVLRFEAQKASVLLAYLAYHLSRPHLREALIELLWPECEPRAGRNRLSVALSSLRHQLEQPGTPTGAVLVADRASVQLNPARVTTDVAEFEAALQAAVRVDGAERARWLARAVELYRGELLAGYYEDWVLSEREWLAGRYFQALGPLIAHLTREGDLARALELARRGVEVDPLREEAHRALMCLLAQMGQPAAALRQYHELERILNQELGETPSEATRRLVEEIRDPGVQAFRRSGVQEREGVQAFRHSGVQEGESVPDSGTLSDLNARTPEHLNARSAATLEPVGGAVPLDSPFYLERPTDGEFRAAIARHDSIVLIQGASQVGKTSLLARGVQHAREAGARVVLTDLQKLNAEHLASADAFCRTLAQWIADQLHLDAAPEDVWHARRGPSVNLEQYLRRAVLDRIGEPIVWGLDEVDRLFECDFGSEIFRLFRSWHNERALAPSGPWRRFTLAIAYATEAHLFITDANQSPFNVGTPLTLEDFTPEQVADLNRRYGSPLAGEEEVRRLYQLVSGHPYLVRLALHELATRGTGIGELEERGAAGEGIFAGHLRRLLVRLQRDPDLCEALRGVLQGKPCPTPESFYRLRSAGVVVGDSARDARPRCQLYATYLARRLL